MTIDGETFTDVGLKLKGNSSLRGISVDGGPAQDLPFRIRLDKYVDDQQLKGISDFTVRSNSSETSMNEAVALDLLTDAGLASTQAIATRFSVNGGDETLRLTVQNLDDTWGTQLFPRRRCGQCSLANLNQMAPGTGTGKMATTLPRSISKRVRTTMRHSSRCSISSTTVWRRKLLRNCRIL